MIFSCSRSPVWTCGPDICWRWGHRQGGGWVWLFYPFHPASCKGSTPVQPISTLICHKKCLIPSFLLICHQSPLDLKLAGDTGSVTVPGSILHQLLVQPELLIWSSSSSSSPALQYQWIPIFWWDHNSPVGSFGQYESVACIVSSFKNRQPHHLIILIVWSSPNHLQCPILWLSPSHCCSCGHQWRPHSHWKKISAKSICPTCMGGGCVLPVPSQW